MLSLNKENYRDSIVEYLKDKLMGPELSKADIFQQVSDDPPSSMYSLGKLYPKDSVSENIIEEQDSSSDNSAPTEEDPLSLSFEKLPCSLGVSICVEKGSTIEIHCAAGYYVEVESEEQGKFWERVPKSETLSINKTFSNQLIFGDGISLAVRRLDFGKKEILTISLTNERKTKTKKKFSESDVFFRVSMSCKAVKGKIIPYPVSFKSTSDIEEDQTNFLYRNNRIYGSGHGSSVSWELEENNQNGVCVFLDFMPQAKMYKANTEHESLASVESFNLQKLANKKNSKKDLRNLISPFLNIYEEWIEDEISILNKESNPQLDEVINNLKLKLKTNLNRMREGLDFILENDKALKAFQLANQAMLMQMIHGSSNKEYSVGSPPDHQLNNNLDYFDNKYIKNSWRPFQLGFFLLTAKSTALEEDEARDLVDLIWFPTGGGKTEAYLLLIAFQIFYRRLSDQEDDGVVVLMRYTYRLLTQDQFSRAAALICCCEKIRVDNSGIGIKPITLGLWVGKDSSPNSFLEAKGIYDELLKEEKPINPFTLTCCPWCNTKMVPDEREPADYYGFRSSETKFELHCPSVGCNFHDSLPLNIVDDYLYENPPTFLVGTIDKFARFAWLDRPGAFLGAREGTSPPSIIIQDELHLVTGPLGTIAGVYEAAFDSIIQKWGGKPKYIAATATIRGSMSQCELLYDRRVNLFPPSGHLAEHSFFSTPDIKSPGRLYLGIMTQGESPFTSTARISAAALQATEAISSDGSADMDRAYDAYRTLVIFHNSIRELGRSLSLLGDDIPDRIKVLEKDPNKQRELNAEEGVKELSSKVEKSELANTRKSIEIESHSNSVNFIDALATTNIISVGVDIPRLGLMEIVGQPKTTAEFIQSSSRVGRADVPGLILVNYKAVDARDRSHFEQFKAYIESAYRFVEPSSVTPYAMPSRIRSLHAALIIVMRHSGLGMNKNEDANKLDINHPQQIEVIDRLKDRMKHADPTESSEIEKDFKVILKIWAKRIKTASDLGRSLRYKHKKGQSGLIKDFGEYPDSPDVLETLGSMRSVDSETEIKSY